MDPTRIRLGQRRHYMDHSGNGTTWTDSAVLVQANHFQFNAGHDTWIRMIGSRMLLWGISGRGSIFTGGRELELGAGDAIVLPWHSDVRYVADRVDPYLTGAVHLLPWHDARHPIDPRAGHGDQDPLNHVPYRGNRHWPGFDEPLRMPEPGATHVIRLGEAAVDYFAEQDPDEAGLRAFGLLITRAVAAQRARSAAATAAPPTLVAMQEYARSHLREELTTQELATVTGCSTSTVERQFRRYANATPTEWIRRERLTAGARLLRTSSRRIAEIAAEVGFSDPLYFSRVFRQEFGVPPSRYARRTPLI